MASVLIPGCLCVISARGPLAAGQVPQSHEEEQAGAEGRPWKVCA